jgi:hypothetical protein
MMIGFKTFPWGKTDIRWNFAFRHFFTSFGTDLSFRFFMGMDNLNFIATYHNYQNYKHIFPAIEFEIVDYPVQIGNLGMYVSPKLIIGMQPKEQNFFTSEAEFFWLFGSRVDFQLHKHWLPYMEFAVKTNGWVSGNEYLGKNINCKIGISARF